MRAALALAFAGTLAGGPPGGGRDGTPAADPLDRRRGRRRARRGGSRFRVLRRLDTGGGGHPHDVKIARNMAVVANQATERVQLVKLDGTVLRWILLDADPHDLAIDPTGRHAWITLEGSDDLSGTDWEGALHVYRGRRARPVRSIPLGVEAHHLDFTPDGRFCWITDHGAGAVFVVRTGTVRVGAGPHGVWASGS